jgi:hypothetical protein
MHGQRHITGAGPIARQRCHHDAIRQLQPAEVYWRKNIEPHRHATSVARLHDLQPLAAGNYR